MDYTDYWSKGAHLVGQLFSIVLCTSGRKITLPIMIACVLYNTDGIKKKILDILFLCRVSGGMCSVLSYNYPRP